MVSYSAVLNANRRMNKHNMAFMRVFAFAVLFSFTLCAAEPDNCTQCKLSPVGEGFASEFHLKASEKGVRLVYLNLKIGNESYRPLELQDEFLPARWVWANTISEPMLSLPEDFDILSLGLLNFQIRSMDVHFKDQPSGCLAKLNSSWQNMAVGRMLLENVITEDNGKLSLKTRVVCVAMIKTADSNNLQLNNTVYHCCGMQNPRSNGSFIRCNLTVASSSWLETLNLIVLSFSFFMAFYIPALPLSLPECIFSLQYECDKEDRAEQQPEINSGQADSRHARNGYIQINQNEEEEDGLIPVDNASPMAFSTFLLVFFKRLPDVALSFNIKLAIMWFCVYPCVVYVQLALYRGCASKSTDESLRKHVPIDSLILVNSDVNLILFLAAIAFMGLIPVLFLRPKDLILDPGIPCILCNISDHRLDLPIASSSRSVGDEMRHHLKILYHGLYNLIKCFAQLFLLGFKHFTILFLCSQCSGLKMNRFRRAVCILWFLVFILPTLLVGFVWGAVCLFLFLLLSSAYTLAFSPLVSLMVSSFPIIMTTILMTHCGSLSIPVIVMISIFSVIFFVVLLVSLIINFIVIYLSCSFFTNVLGFTIVGLVLNADIVTPYVAFFLVVTTNIYLCFSNLQNRYKEVKGMILKWKNEFGINSRDPEDTIPSKLFWFVCDRVLPIQRELCLMFRNVVFILAFLFLVVYSIVFFGNEYNVSAVFSTIAVFVSGVIPALVLKGLTKENMFIGWKKITIKKEIKTAVREFHQGNNRNSTDIGGSQSIV